MYQTINGIKVWGSHDEQTIKQMSTLSENAVYTALMADGHVGYSQSIGGVVAYNGYVSPSGVGYDIGCGNTAVRLDVKFSEIKERMPDIMDNVFKTISFGIGRHNDERVEHELFDYNVWNLIPFVRGLKEMANAQLGTVGSGNHYVDIFREEHTEDVWVGVHFGSRGLGHKIATEYLKRAGGKDGMFVDATLIDVDSDLGEEYLLAMELAGRYAHAGREWVANRVAKIIGGEVTKTVNNHHNFAWLENHFGQDVWVVRKGATPLFPGQQSFVGSTMADKSYILEGVDGAESRKTMYSTVHGAGRIMSRTAASGKSKWVKGKKTSLGGGLVSPEMMKERVDAAGVELRGAGVDESPHCYKRLDEVLKYHLPTLNIVHTLTPVGVAMAGSDVVDPFKD